MFTTNWFYDLPTELRQKIELRNRAEELCVQHRRAWSRGPQYLVDPERDYYSNHPEGRPGYEPAPYNFRQNARYAAQLLVPEEQQQDLAYLVDLGEPPEERYHYYERPRQPPGRSAFWGAQLDALDLDWGRVEDGVDFRLAWYQIWSGYQPPCAWWQFYSHGGTVDYEDVWLELARKALSDDGCSWCGERPGFDDDGNFEYPEGMPQLQGLGMDTYDSDDDAQFVM